MSSDTNFFNLLSVSKIILLQSKRDTQIHGYSLQRRREKRGREHNQQWWLNQFDALIKKAAGDISSHLRPLVCVQCVRTLLCARGRQCVRTCVCAKMSVSNKAAGGVCWGASLCLPTLPPPSSPCQSHRVCCHDVPTGKAYRLSILPLCLAFSPLFVSLYTLHNVRLSLPLVLSCYYIVDNVIPALSGCRIVPRVTPRVYLCRPRPPSLSDGELCWQLCYGFSLSELLPCLPFWDLMWQGIIQLTHMFATDTL